MGETLVAYFSATGTTAALAKRLALVTDADLYEIRPAVPYTTKDLNWQDQQSRSTLEMQDLSSRPEITDTALDIGPYDTIYLGFPIWWGVAPTIVLTFLEQHNWAGKTIIPFATSGSSGMGDTNAELTGSCPDAVLKEGKRFEADAGEEELKEWTKSL